VPRLEFLANMNISPLTVEQLRKNGWNVVRISEVMDRGSKDIDILYFLPKISSMSSLKLPEKHLREQN